MHDAILTAINYVVLPRVEMAVRSITGSSGNGPNSTNSIVQHPDRRDFTRNTENTPLRSASSRLDLNIDQDIIDETRDIDNSEDGDFPATRLSYDQRAEAHYMVTGVGYHVHHKCWTFQFRTALIQRKSAALIRSDQRWRFSCFVNQRWKFSNLGTSAAQHWISLGLQSGIFYQIYWVQKSSDRLFLADNMNSKHELKKNWKLWKNLLSEN